MKELLNILSTEMQALSINYDYVTYKKKPIEYPYCVSRVFVSDYTNEDMQTKGEILINAFDRDLSYINLIELEEKIKNKFRDYSKIQNGVAVQISYLGSNENELDDDLLKSREIRLEFALWERSI